MINSTITNKRALTLLSIVSSGVSAVFVSPSFIVRGCLTIVWGMQGLQGMGTTTVKSHHLNPGGLDLA